MPSDSSTHPRIVIVGGGLGGLALLLTLHRRGVPATLYERDTSSSTRAHLGAPLDLGWESGQRALRENGLQVNFEESADSEGRRIYDGAGTLHFSHGAGAQGGSGRPEGPPPPQRPEDSRPEIERAVLRKLLLDAIPPHLIKWDHALVSVRSLGHGQHELTFANGFTTVSDILVGADGANSRVRPLLSPATPIYTDVKFIDISLAPETTKLPELQGTVASIGKWTLLVMQNSRMLGSRMCGDGRIRTFAAIRESADWTLPSDPAEAKAVTKTYFAGWQQWMLNLIDYADESAIYIHALYVLPAGHSWPHVRGVTLIGDAAHLMSPFAGAGANLALLDGLELGLALAGLATEGKLADQEAVDEAVVAFEENMCSRAGRIAKQAEDNLHEFIHPDAPHPAIRRFKQVFAEGRHEG
ncbi:hypothetical protein BD309DRAFT_894704 [Dichomitus squalens]|uniref:FAD-binding domain-containing protein n=1 Tax=Dichomitus squalens TaxID=114155 RepID=A0A4Q9Q749_9APHY|nr:hypothetical protein BD309DRAFT_894704 [Dichomitus squalens]TBU63343.1 hypothetical protein BD310DRAFT_917261 [Dichomitus squalens]